MAEIFLKGEIAFYISLILSSIILFIFGFYSVDKNGKFDPLISIAGVSVSMIVFAIWQFLAIFCLVLAIIAMPFGAGYLFKRIKNENTVILFYRKNNKTDLKSEHLSKLKDK